MLDPNARSLLTDALIPPSGMQFDTGLATTYSLDPTALLTVPIHLAWLASGQDKNLMADPIRMLEALRRVASRLTVFCQRGRMQAPDRPHVLYGLLEQMLHESVAPCGGSFHAKLWLLRYVSERADAQLLRLIVQSRNLTFDRSWDISLKLDGAPSGTNRRHNIPLGKLLGLGYRYGHVDGKRDWKKAKTYLQRLGNNDDARAQLAEISYLENADDDAMVREAVGTIRQLAQNGNSRAQLLLAECVFGYPMPRDGACARTYFEKVALEFPAAASNLGLLYEAGYGGPVDYVEAAKWFRKAIETGFGSSQYELGRLLLRNGRSTDAQRSLLALADTDLVAYVLLRYCNSHRDCTPNAAQRKSFSDRLEHLSADEKNSLAWGLSTDVMSDAEDATYAVKLMQSIPKEERSKYALLDTLAAAYARAGDFDSAIATARECVAKVPDSSKHQRAIMEERLRQFSEKKTWDLPY